MGVLRASARHYGCSDAVTRGQRLQRRDERYGDGSNEEEELDYLVHGQI